MKIHKCVYQVLFFCLPFMLNAQSDSVRLKHPKINLQYKYTWHTREHVSVADSSISGYYFSNNPSNVRPYDEYGMALCTKENLKDNKNAYRYFKRRAIISDILILPDMVCLVSGAVFFGVFIIDGHGPNPIPGSFIIEAITGGIFGATYALHVIMNNLEMNELIKGVKIYNHDNGYI